MPWKAAVIPFVLKKLVEWFEEYRLAEVPPKPTPTLPRELTNKRYIIIHHTASKDHPTLDWGGLRKYHLGKGWRDIGYQRGIELVDDHYEVLIGRYEHDSGAHCPQEGMNHQGLGVAVVGNFQLAPPPPGQWQKCLEDVRHTMKRLGIPKENVLGHREVPGTATACPGKYWDMNKFREEL